MVPIISKRLFMPIKLLKCKLTQLIVLLIGLWSLNNVTTVAITCIIQHDYKRH